jgi:SNARE protein
MPKLKGTERQEKCQYLKNRITRAKQVLRSINVEIRGLPNTLSHPWEAKAKGYEEQISKLAQDIEWAETTNTAADGSKVAPAKKNIDEMTTGEVTKHALKVQDKTQESTQRAKKALEETIEVIKCDLFLRSEWPSTRKSRNRVKRLKKLKKV